jgi:integrase
MYKPLKKGQKSWNSGLVVGPKAAFTLQEIHQIEAHLQSRQNRHDLALLSLGIDSMLRASDLLKLQVWQVIYPNGKIRSTIAMRQQKTKRTVFPALTPVTKMYFSHWLERSQKSPKDFIFTRSKPVNSAPITRAHYAEIIKAWAEMLGLEPGQYSTHSVRRTKPVHLYENGEDIALISKLLGHKSIAVTIEYLGITQKKAEAASLRYSMMRGQKAFGKDK